MKIRFTILFICILSRIVCVADTNTSANIDGLINQLSWDSIHLNCEALMLTARLTGEASTNLINLGKPATTALLSAMEDKEKCVAAHLILTEIWLPSESGSIQSGECNDRGTTNEWSFTHNQIIPLTWIDDSEGRHIESNAQLDEARHMWAKLISLRTNNCISQNEAILLNQTENITTECPPITLYNFSLQKINQGNCEDAAWAYLVAVAYGKYDSLRVEDNSSDRVAEMFLHDFICNYPKNKENEFRLALTNIVAKKDCWQKLRRLGRPTYKPSYMIQFTSSGLKGDATKVDNSNLNELWEKVIDQLQNRL